MWYAKRNETILYTFKFLTSDGPKIYVLACTGLSGWAAPLSLFIMQITQTLGWFNHDFAYIVDLFVATEAVVVIGCHMSRLVGKPTMWFPNRSDTNRPVQSQKRARSLKFWS